MMNGKIDLRSDTVTWPTAEMRKAMAEAAVGDDVYGDDPTILELENCAASLLGKEAGLFVPSGTMGNQLALMSQVNRGEEVILSDRCHIVVHEAGAPAILSGAQLRCLPVVNGQMNPDQIEATIRKDPANIHSPRTALICLEEADSDGLVHELDYLERVSRIAGQYQIPIHMDGARLFNAATTLGVSARTLALHADTVQICLSKGLCAPVGSILAGKADVINLARRKRKILGGAMRQAGILAAAGLIALNKMAGRLAEDHANAAWLAKQLAARPEKFEIVRKPMINMVFFRLNHYPLNGEKLVEALSSKNILINPPEDGELRFVTHYWVDRPDLEYCIQALDDLG